MRDQNYLFHVLHTLDNLIVHSPLMSFNACKLMDNLQLQDPKLLLQRWPAMLQSSKVVQAYSTVTPLFCSRGFSRKGNHDQVGEMTRTRPVGQASNQHPGKAIGMICRIWLSVYLFLHICSI